VYRPEEGGVAVQRYRRLMAMLGWLAAFLMAVGAGWKWN
jgi:hypothetical protein